MEEAVDTVVEAAVEVVRKPLNLAQKFAHLTASGGIVLMIASIAALIIANSPLYETYNYILNEVDFRIGFSDPGEMDFELKKSVLLWINDGLMAIFFFLVGLEIKREFLEGELSSREQALLPALAAVGGMAIPALIYFFINQDVPQNLDGWAIPAATDIAFALAILSLAGKHVPTSLKALLLGIAVMDDLGAILIIAVFYSHGLVIMPLFFAAAALAGLLFFNLRGDSNIIPYIFFGVVMWVAVLESGIHATIAGVIAALCVPLTARDDPDNSPCKRLQHDLHPWVAFGVLPVFGFANAGVPFKGMGLDSLLDPVTLGIAAALFFGKQIGVFGILALTILSGLSPKPKGASWVHLYAVAVLCGIGFTMSLFIGGLAFQGIEMQASVRLGVLIGSVASAVLAFGLLKYGPSAAPEKS